MTWHVNYSPLILRVMSEEGTAPNYCIATISHFDLATQVMREAEPRENAQTCSSKSENRIY